MDVPTRCGIRGSENRDPFLHLRSFHVFLCVLRFQYGNLLIMFQADLLEV